MTTSHPWPPLVQHFCFDKVLADRTNSWTEETESLGRNLPFHGSVEASNHAKKLAKKLGFPVRISDPSFAWATTYLPNGERCASYVCPNT